MIIRFSLNEDINCSARCVFMTKLTSVDECRSMIESKPDLLNKLISSWVICVICGQNTATFTKNMLTFTVVSKYLPQESCLGPDTDDCVLLLSQFIEAIGQEYTNASTPAVALQVKVTIGSYFSALIKIAEPILNDTTNVQSIKKLYDVTSCLARKCSKALYSKVRIFYLSIHGLRCANESNQ